MKWLVRILFFALLPMSWAASLRLSPDGQLRAQDVPAPAIITVEGTNALPVTATNWPALRNYYVVENADVMAGVGLTNAAGFLRLRVFDLTGVNGFSNFVAAHSTLTTVAGAGGATGSGVNKWLPAYENGPATSAQLSRPHIALGDDAGNIYIADKDAHGIRKVRPDGTIVTVAGTSVAGNGPDTATTATAVALNEPNGLWVRGDGTFYILDLMNAKVRKVDTNGLATTLFAVPGGIASGRGLWVSDDETLAFVASGTVLKRWTPGGGVENYSTGYADLGNISVEFSLNSGLVVTDRGGHAVYALDASDTPPIKRRIAGTGVAGVGIDGAMATNCPLNQVRGVWALPTGGYLLATDNGSQLWYVDLEQRIHLLLNGSSANTSHSGDGAYFYDPSALKVSKIRQVTLDREGNMLITEHDAGYVRKVRFLPR
jgi:sugar lactone lactonase YvrE